MLAAIKSIGLAALLAMALAWQPAMAKRVAGSTNLATEDSYINHDGLCCTNHPPCRRGRMTA
ncbi:DUF3761 domain-containing protein [Chromobacterium amazonense]|uniref:DUF3761 domain-containing protein n=1 Tax=Chromobacterium amazonense TaxID=1382803 RepID=UPI001114054F